jgi:phage recombination protein Bet
MSQSTALVARLARPAAANHIPPEHWQIICDVIWPEAKDPLVITTAWNLAIARKLDPFKKPFHIVPTYSRAARRMVESIWPAIGELQTTAARNGWVGMDLPEWGPVVKRTFKGIVENEDRSTSEVSVTVEFPEWAAVTVYRLIEGHRYAFSEVVFWTEAYARVGFRSELPNDMWRKRPRGQLGKVAKAAALRSAFPEDAGGLPTGDEMEGQETNHAGPTIDGVVDTPSPPPRQNGRAPAQSTSERQRAEIEQTHPMNRPAPVVDQPLREAAQRQPAAAQPATNGGAWATPPDIPKEFEPDPARGGWVQPDYPIVYPNGSTKMLHAGSDWIIQWRGGIGQLAGRREILVGLRAANGPAIGAVAQFDAEAAAEVERMLVEAIGPTEPAAPTIDHDPPEDEQRTEIDT